LLKERKLANKITFGNLV